jgi:hypothetical protein
MEDYTKLFINIQTSRNKKIAKSRQLKNIIEPLLTCAAKSLYDISNRVAPIPSVKYLHDRTERKKLRKVVNESNSRMSPELQLVSNYELHEERKKKGVTSIMPLQKRTKISHQQMSLGDKCNVTLSQPSNGVQYHKPEVVNELRKYEKRSKEIGTAMINMINMHYVPCGVHTHCCMMTIDAAEDKPTPDTPWSMMRDRKPIAGLEEMQTIAEDLDSQSSRGWCSDDVSTMLGEIQSKKMNGEGYVPLTTPAAHKKSVRNYTALLAHQTNMSISQSCILKTTTKNAAEHSLYGPICKILLIG